MKGDKTFKTCFSTEFVPLQCERTFFNYSFFFSFRSSLENLRRKMSIWTSRGVFATGWRNNKCQTFVTTDEGALLIIFNKLNHVTNLRFINWAEMNKNTKYLSFCLRKLNSNSLISNNSTVISLKAKCLFSHFFVLKSSFPVQFYFEKRCVFFFYSNLIPTDGFCLCLHESC